MSYKTRMMNHRDPRYRKIARALYRTRDQVAAHPATEVVEDIADVRAQYEEVVGKKPFYGWDIVTLRRKMAEHETSQSADGA